MAGPTGLEPATSTVTVWRSSQLSYGPVYSIKSPQTVPGGIDDGKFEKTDTIALMKRFSWHWALFALFLALFFYGLNAQYPLLGHDYFYYWPRMVEGQWHFLRQGLAPLRFAIHLCGGFPQYGNPQDLFYSLPQFLSFFMGLWSATQLSILSGMLVGYVGWVTFGKDVLKMPSSWAQVLALVCSASGFHFVHMAVGHLSYFTLPLMSWVLWALLHRERESGRVLTQRAAIVAFACAVILYSGAYIAPFIIVPLFLFLLPLDLALAPEGLRSRSVTLARRWAAFLPAILALCCSKLVAVFSLMQSLPRTADFQTYTSDQNVLFLAIKSLWVAPQLPGFFTTEPFNRIHEESMFTSPVALIGMALLLVVCARHTHFTRSKKIALVAYGIVVTAFLLAVVNGTGFVATTVHSLPFFSSLRISERFLYVLALLWSVGGVLGFSLFMRERFALGASVLTVVAFALAYGPLVSSLEYTVPYPAIRDRLAAEPSILELPVMGVQDYTGVRVSDFNYLFNGTTGTRCYEPLLGGFERQTLLDGPVNLAWSGALNVYNPACLHYPEANNCAPGDRIAIEDIGNLEHFINGEDTTWKISAAQKWADGVTLAALLSLIGIAGTSVWKRVRRAMSSM